MLFYWRTRHFWLSFLSIWICSLLFLSLSFVKIFDSISEYFFGRKIILWENSEWVRVEIIAFFICASGLFFLLETLDCAFCSLFVICGKTKRNTRMNTLLLRIIKKSPLSQIFLVSWLSCVRSVNGSTENKFSDVQGVSQKNTTFWP